MIECCLPKHKLWTCVVFRKLWHWSHACNVHTEMFVATNSNVLWQDTNLQNWSLSYLILSFCTWFTKPLELDCKSTFYWLCVCFPAVNKGYILLRDYLNGLTLNIPNYNPRRDSRTEKNRYFFYIHTFNAQWISKKNWWLIWYI